MQRNIGLIARLALALCLAPLASAQGVDASLNESVVQVPKRAGPFTLELETTIYKPAADGPFPVVVINHGKADGNPRFQPRYRPNRAVRYFLQRGYAVVVPMRQGFSKSEGMYIGGGCNVESNGRAQAEDVAAAIEWVRAQPWADRENILVLGQSHGGWTTLAFGAAPSPGVRGLVNFAGGLRQDDCNGWRAQLASGAANYAKQSKLPSLWFYGDNDSFFDAPTWRAMYSQYKEAGGRARLVAFGAFGSDAHSLFNSAAGGAIWEPEMTRFLEEIGMPSEPVAAYARFAPRPPMAAPAATRYAPFDDETRVPFLKAEGRTGYKVFLSRTFPRAFAISPQGAWAWANGGDDPLLRALDTCNRYNKGACRLYAVDDAVVWADAEKPDPSGVNR